MARQKKVTLRTVTSRSFFDSIPVTSVHSHSTRQLCHDFHISPTFRFLTLECLVKDRDTDLGLQRASLGISDLFGNNGAWLDSHRQYRKGDHHHPVVCPKPHPVTVPEWLSQVRTRVCYRRERSCQSTQIRPSLSKMRLKPGATERSNSIDDGAFAH
jgi:hypothetical protein